MADTKITQLQPPQVGYPVVPATDVLPIVVIADPGMATSGSTRKVTVNQLLGAGGTATLASATISGDLTVRTTGLVVNSTGASISNSTPLSGVDSGLLVGTVGSSKSVAISMANCLARLRERDAVNNFAITTNIGPTGTIDDNTRSSWKIRIGSGNENFALERAPAGSATFQGLLNIDSGGVCTWSDGAGGTRMTLNAAGLGVGASPANGRLIVGADATTDGNGSWNTTLRNTVGAATTAPKTGLAFSGYWNGTSNFANFAGISGGKENTTDANTAGILTMWTSPNGGSPTTRLTIDSSGNVGIGVTPSYKLDVLGTGNAGIMAVTTNAQTSSLRLRQTQNLGPNTRNWEIRTNGGAYGNIEFAVGASQQSDTYTAAMVLDASGNLLVGATTVSPSINGAGAIAAKGVAGITLQTVSALATDYTLPIGAFAGILTIRSNGGGGSAVWMLDPNGGAVQISNNIVGRTITFTFSGGSWKMQQTVGTVPSTYNYLVLATQ